MPRAERSHLQKWTFLVLFAGALYAFWRTLEPIWVPVLLGLVIAVGVHPLHEKIVRKLHGRHPGLPAAGLTALVMAASLAIMGFLIFVVGHRVVDFARQLSDRYQHKGAVGLLGRDVASLLSRFGLSAEDIQQRVADTAREVATWAGKGATGIVTGLFSAIFIFIFTALTSYYLLKEGNDGTSWLVEMVPLPDGQVREIVADVRDVVRAMLLSTGLLAIYQGVIAGVGYWIFGVDGALVWAALTAVASIMPAVGTALVWVPVGLVTMATGHFGRGLGVLAWGAVLVVFVADYVLRPRLVGTRIR